MAAVGQTAKELGSDLTLPATSAADAAAVMTELAKASFTVEEAQEAAKGSLQLAAAAQIDAARAATIQASALQAFSLDADQAGRVSDVLANSANASAAEITDVADALAQASAVAAATGISIEDTAATIGILANNGIRGSDAGTLLKSALLALQSPSGPASRAMEALGVSAYDAAGNFVGLSAIFGQLAEAQREMTPEAYAAATSTLFGSDAARLAGIAGKEGAEGFDAMAAAMSRSGSAAEVAEAKARGVGGAIEAFQSQVETFQIDLFERAAPELERVIRYAAENFPDVGNAIIDAFDDGVGYVLQFADTAEDALAAVADYVSPITSELDDLWASLTEAGGPAEIFFDLAKGGAGILLALFDAASPVVDVVGDLVGIFADLPGPMQAAVIALVALKVAASKDLIGRLSARGGLGGALVGVGTSAANMGREVANVGDRLRGMGDEVRVQRALMEQTQRTTALAAGGYASMADRLRNLTAAGSGTTTQLSRAQEMMRGYDRALGDSVRAASPAITAVNGVRDGYRQAADAHAQMVSRITNGGTDRLATSLAGMNGAMRTLARDGMTAAQTGATNLRVAAQTAATQGLGALRSGAGSLVGFLGGPWGVALTVATLAIGAITSEMQASAQQTQEWGDAMVVGGRKAANALREAMAMDETPTGFDAFQERVGNLLTDDSFRLNSEMEGYVSNVERATQAASDYYNSLSPLEQAQAKVSEWTSTLSYRVGELGLSHEDTRTAQERLAYWTDVLGQRQEETDRATRTLTESIQASTQAALAGTNADLQASMATSQLSEGIADYREKLAAGTMTALEATQASDQMAQTALTTANAVAQQAFAHSTATTETGKQAEADAALLASLRDTAAQLGENTPAAITNLIASLSASSERANATAGDMTDLGLTVLAIPNEREVIIDAPTEEQKGRLEDLGYTVENLPNGQVKVTADVASAQSELAQFLNEPRQIRLGGNPVFTGNSTSQGAGTSVGRALGGAVWGRGSGTSDSIPAMLSNGEYVIRASSVKKYGLGLLNELNVGRFAEGGLVQSTDALDNALSSIGAGKFDAGEIKVNLDLDLDSLSRAADSIATASYASAGPAGSGAIGGTWTSLWHAVSSAIPQARQNSTFRRGDPGYHGRNKAIDFGFGSGPGGAGSAGLASIARFLYRSFGRSLAELIYDGIGDDTPDVKNGRDHTYGAGTRAEHRNHVHAAVYDSGGVLEPGNTLVRNLSGKPEGVLTNEQLGWLQAAASSSSAPLIGGDLVLRVDPNADVRDQMEEAVFQLRRLSRGSRR